MGPLPALSWLSALWRRFWIPKGVREVEDGGLEQVLHDMPPPPPQEAVEENQRAAEDMKERLERIRWRNREIERLYRRQRAGERNR